VKRHLRERGNSGLPLAEMLNFNSARTNSAGNCYKVTIDLKMRSHLVPRDVSPASVESMKLHQSEA
jgi:hypothetical protein